MEVRHQQNNDDDDDDATVTHLSTSDSGAAAAANHSLLSIRTLRPWHIPEQYMVTDCFLPCTFIFVCVCLCLTMKSCLLVGHQSAACLLFSAGKMS